MPVLNNPNPATNPLARRVDFDTLINNLNLNPDEDYFVNGPFINGNIIVTKNGSGNEGKIELSPRHYLHFYLPQPRGKTLFLIPSKKADGWQLGTQDFTASNQLDQLFSSSFTQTWRQDAASKIQEIGITEDGVAKLNISWSVYGVDTNKAEVSKTFTVQYTVPANQ